MGIHMDEISEDEAAKVQILAELTAHFANG